MLFAQDPPYPLRLQQFKTPSSLVDHRSTWIKLAKYLSTLETYTLGIFQAKVRTILNEKSHIASHDIAKRSIDMSTTVFSMNDKLYATNLVPQFAFSVLQTQNTDALERRSIRRPRTTEKHTFEGRARAVSTQHKQCRPTIIALS